MGVEELCRVSRDYGQDAAWVLAGGGNTSFKDEDTLYVKASGFALATLTRKGLVAMDRKKLAGVWKSDYPKDREKREERALSDLMAARLPEDAEKRPSVETLMHDLLPYAYVIHTHPTMVNGLTCAQNGEAEAKRLFGESMIWIPLVDPGYVLAQTIRDMLAEYRERHSAEPKLLFLQNHGLVVASDDLHEIDELHRHVAATIHAELQREPDVSEPADTFRQAGLIEDAVKAALKQLEAEQESGTALKEQLRATEHVHFYTNREIGKRVATREAFAPLTAPFTPDHIVYAGHNPPFVEGVGVVQGLSGRVKQALTAYLEEHGSIPKSIALQGLGAAALGKSGKAAEKAISLFSDAAQLAAYAESFGGPRSMEQEFVDFILSWEVESYREQISTGG